MTEKIIQCPGCKEDTVWDTKNPYRPFCSASCKNQDFIGWANEEKRMSGNSVYDDILSDQVTGDTDFH